MYMQRISWILCLLSSCRSHARVLRTILLYEFHLLEHIDYLISLHCNNNEQFWKWSVIKIITRLKYH